MAGEPPVFDVSDDDADVRSYRTAISTDTHLERNVDLYSSHMNDQFGTGFEGFDDAAPPLFPGAGPRLDVSKSRTGRQQPQAIELRTPTEISTEHFEVSVPGGAPASEYLSSPRP